MDLLSNFKEKFNRWQNIREINQILPLVKSIFVSSFSSKDITDQVLKSKTAEFKERIKKEPLDAVLVEAFTVAREAVRRILGKWPYEEQILAGVAMHQGKVIEMKSGEGKTIAEIMPVYLNALDGGGVHIITTNDYLVQRDAGAAGPIFNFLGLSVGTVTETMERAERKKNYAKDITYVSNKEVGFDYLRDNMVYDMSERVLRGLNFGIIDEVDSILIDEARTPLIIAQAAEHPEQKNFLFFADLSSRLKEDIDYEVDEKFWGVYLTEEGEKKLTEIFGGRDTFLKEPQFNIHLNLALKAKSLYQKDRDYLIEDGKVVLIDEFTGRLTPDRRLMEDLHQAIEAKERLEITEKNRIFAQITFQNFFQLYKKWSGMTGTAVAAKDEFWEVYEKEIIVAPTRLPVMRRDLRDVFYLTEEGKFKCIIEEAARLHRKGQPVLIGARTVEGAMKMSQKLADSNIPHQLLTAKHHEKEAELIARAGEEGAVTVATNMAGRGTDIMLKSSVCALGGLHVIGTERHAAGRIDDQLRGRAGRQGQPGSSQFHVSMEDELMQIYGSDELWQVVEDMTRTEDRPMSNMALQEEANDAQKLAENLNFDSRKWLFQFDQVFERQRATICKIRDKFLNENGDNLGKRKTILKIVDEMWQGHLEDLEELKQGINLFVYANKDPLVEYGLQAKQLFERLVAAINIKISQISV